MTGEKKHGAGHLAFLDGVRGFACLYVMMHHAVLDLPASASRVRAALDVIFAQGHYAVDVFIVLSGYCLMLPLLRSGARLSFLPFMIRRAIRIVPTYYAAMAFSLVSIATLVGTKTGSNWDASLPVTSRDLLLHVLLIHEWSPRSMFHISSPFWSIGVEWKIYFLMPLLFALRNRYGAWRMACGAFVFGYAAWLVIRHFGVLNPSPYGSSFYYIGLFAAGMWAADLEVRNVSAASWGLARSALAALSLVLGVLTWLNRDDVPRVLPVQVMCGVVGVWAALGLAILRHGSLTALKRACTWGPMTYFGRMGFTIYLIHAPIAQMVNQYVIARSPWSDTWRALLMPPIYLISTLAVAIPFFHLFERPFHALSRRQWLRPAPIDDAARLQEQKL